MPNQLAQNIELMFGELVEGFEMSAIASMEVKKFSPSQQTMQRAGDTVWRFQDFMFDTVSGLDVSGASKTDLIQRQVPATYRAPENVLYRMDALQMRDEQTMKDAGRDAGRQLSAKIDTDLCDHLALRAVNVIKNTGAMTWKTVSTAEAILRSHGLPAGKSKTLLVNPFDALELTDGLAQRQTYAGKVVPAYEENRLPNVSGFRTFQTDVMTTLAKVGTVSGITSASAQSHTVTAKTGDLPTDNRGFTFNIAGANLTNVKNGDVFTLTNGTTPINTLHEITKQDSGKPQTFRVISGGGTANIVIWPAPVATGPYRNVSAAIASGATLTFLNTQSASTNVAFVDGSVELMAGRLAFPKDQGAKVLETTSKNGIPLIMSYNFNHLTGITDVRFNAMYGITILQPNMTALILNNQT